jgi:hypothetical protein
MDALLTLSDAQALTAGTTVSTHKVPLPAASNQLAGGEPLSILFIVDVAASGSTDTFDFSVITDADEALGSPTVHSTNRIAKALLVAGASFAMDVPGDIEVNEKYLGHQVLVGSGDGITISAYVVPRSFVQRWAAYAKGYVS